MRMETRIAFSNMKYHKSKNILIGVAIFLTTLLLFIVPTAGAAMIDGQSAAVNEIYPIWHALYRNVSDEMVTRLSAHHVIERYGLRSDAGIVASETADIAMIYLDEEGLALYRMELMEGRLPQRENEIVVSQGMLKELGYDKEVGDTVQIPYQIYRDGGLDRMQQKEFVISGLIEGQESDTEKNVYTALVSKAFLEEELLDAQISYRFLFRVNGEGMTTTDDVTAAVRGLAEEFGIGENDTRINEDYLMANYVDPSIIPILAGVMLIIVAAGIITIYSIYYVSMDERIREFGKLRAVGANRRQIRRIVLGEGLSVALFAMPCGLIVGSVIAKFGFPFFVDRIKEENEMTLMISSLFAENRVPIFHGWCYLLAVLVTALTVYLSLLKPMKTASKVSVVEAMRCQGSGGLKKRRKGCRRMSVFRLSGIYLTGNRRKSVVTICSMGITGVLIMVAATVLSCANPRTSASNSIEGQYEIRQKVEEGNKEHPEREWKRIVQNNPLTESLREELMAVDGVECVESFVQINVRGEAFREAYEEEPVGILGVPESFREELMDGIIRGETSYERLLEADSVIVDKNLLRWCPDIDVGTILQVTVCDGEAAYEKELTVAAVGSYSIGFTDYNFLIMPKEAAESLGSHNPNRYFRVYAKEDYNEQTEMQLNGIIAGSPLLEMRTYKEEYDRWRTSLAMISGVCYAFLVILSAICMMNMINTMIHNVHIRRKELGMLQAVGMSNSQLIKMLLLEGGFYSAGTLILTIGGGSALGYPVFLWVKEDGMFHISQYSYPVKAALIVAAVLLLVQAALAVLLAKSVQKESLIERIRFSE